MANKVKQDDSVKSMQFNPADYPVNPSTREPMKINNYEFDLGAVRRVALDKLEVSEFEQTTVSLNQEGGLNIELN